MSNTSTGTVLSWNKVVLFPDTQGLGTSLEIGIVSYMSSVTKSYWRDWDKLWATMIMDQEILSGGVIPFNLVNISRALKGNGGTVKWSRKFFTDQKSWSCSPTLQLESILILFASASTGNTYVTALSQALSVQYSTCLASSSSNRNRQASTLHRHL